MATTQAEFQELADELIDDEFAPGFPLRTFSRANDDYDPMTGTNTVTTESVACGRIEYNASQFDSNLIQVGDFKLITKVSAFDVIDPDTDGLMVDVDGKNCQVIRAEKDIYNVVWTFQVRAS